jgi:hypothetical protein
MQVAGGTVRARDMSDQCVQFREDPKEVVHDARGTDAGDGRA